MTSVEIPWGAWYETAQMTLSFPDRFEVFSPPVPEGPDLSSQSIRRALESPVGSRPLTEILRGRGSLAVAVDDLTRPTPAARFLPWIMETARAEGISPEDITVVVAAGAHRPLQRADLLKKLGPEVAGRVAVFNHSPYGDLLEFGQTRRGTPVNVNCWFASAEVKMTLGAVLPHPTAGFGGGAKMVMPGLASIEALERNHGPAVRDVAGRVGQLEGNALRADFEEAASKVGVDFSINVVCPAVGVVAAVVAGHPVEAHKRACEIAGELFSIPSPPWLADIACFNAYPKDTELLQVANAFNVWSDRETQLVVEGGTVVVLTAASEGLGTHGLLGPGGRLYRPLAERPGFARLFEGRGVAVVCPTVSKRELRLIMPPSSELFTDWPRCLEFLEERHRGPARVAVFSASAQQMISE